MKSLLCLLLMLLLLSPADGKELSEQSSVQLLIKNNLELAASKFQIDLTRADELTAGLWSNPTLLIDSQLNPLGKSWNQKNAGGPTQRDFILSMPLDLNGKRRQAVTVAKLATKVSEAYFQGLMREKILELLLGLHKLNQLRSELQVLREKEELLEKSVSTLERRFGSGHTQPLVQNRAKLALDNSKLQTRLTALEAVKQESSVRLLLNLAEDESLELNLANAVLPTLVLSELVNQAKETRPEFRALTILKEQSTEQLNLEERRIWDDVILQGGFSRQERLNSRPGDSASSPIPGAWSWIVGVVVPIPVFDRNQGSILATKIQQNQVEVRTRYFERELEKQISDALKGLQTQARSLTLYRSEQLKSAKAVRDSALRQFGSGASSLLEYLDAVDAYHSTISSYISTQYEMNGESLRLRYLAGLPL